MRFEWIIMKNAHVQRSKSMYIKLKSWATGIANSFIKRNGNLWVGYGNLAVVPVITVRRFLNSYFATNSCKIISNLLGKMQFKKVTHVIFDMDGLLIESESVYDKIIGDIAREHGKEYTLPIKLSILGTPEKDTARIAVDSMQLPLTPEEFLVTYKERVRKELQNPVLMPGAKELVKHLSKNDIPIAVATSSSQEAMEMKTKNHQDIFKLFHHIVCGSSDPEVKNGKPAPDIFLICASRFPDKPDPSKCLVLEDAPNGIQGALKAGMQAVMVPAKEVSEELRKPATLVLESLNDFKPELFGLPARE